jgi:hypothetical protein
MIILVRLCYCQVCMGTKQGDKKVEATKFVMEAWLSPTEFFHWAFHQWKDLLIQQCKFSIITLHHYHEFNLYALVNSC